MRRIPVQAAESALAGALALITTWVVLAWGTSPGGVIFVAGIGGYTAGRQLLFPLREIPRATARGRVVTLMVSCVISLAALLVAGTR